MQMYTIRAYEPTDEKDVVEICYRTGFLGETLEGIGRFEDKYLFALLFCLYYLWFEKENCFVSVDPNGKICGYIMGSKNTTIQQFEFFKKMVPRILARLFTHTLFVSPKTFGTCVLFVLSLLFGFKEKNFEEKYPAHLHINISPEYQKAGLGSMLLSALEYKMVEDRVKGIHLLTSDSNFKAVPFYLKHGYRILDQKRGRAWRGTKEYNELLMAKDLLPQ